MEQRKRGRHRNDCECDWCKQRKAQLAAKSSSKPAEDVGARRLKDGYTSGTGLQS